MPSPVEHVEYCVIYSQARLTVATQQSFWLGFDKFVASFWQLSGGFLLNWPMKMRELGEAELPNAMLVFIQSTGQLRFSQSLHFDWPDATRSHQKVVEKMSKSF